MRKILMLFLFSISLIASATDYFISSSGNDSADGLSSSTSWKTITKLNSEFSGLKPGDRILFNRGDTFKGTLNITQSGSAGNPIALGAYGTGADPIINGFDSISGWTNLGNGVFSKVIPCESSPVMVTVDGENTGMGRFPNKGWMVIDSHNSNLSLTDADLNSKITDWTGAEVAIRVNYFTVNHLPITDHTDQTLTFSTRTIYNLIDGYGYFIQNDLRTLDEYKEWYYNPEISTFFMYFGSEVPTNHTIKVSTTNNACNISNQSYITFNNLSFQGFNNNSFTLNTTPHITIQNCSISFCGGNAVDGVGGEAGTSSYLLFSNNIINDINNNGLILKEQFTNVTISNNKISNVGLISGTGYPKLITTHTGIYIGEGTIGNTSSVVEYNNIGNIGYSGIDFAGTNVTIRFNFINGFCLERDDGGGIYTYDKDTNDSRTCNVLNNIVLNGIGDLSGTPSGSVHCVGGIYCDGNSNGITINGNTVVNCSHSGYYANSNIRGVITGNTFYNNKEQIYLDCITYSDGQNNMQLKRNIAFSKTLNQHSLYYKGNSKLTSTASLDDNYYARPIDDDDVIINWLYPVKAEHFTIAQWQSYSGQDASSHKSPLAITDTNNIRFEYNSSITNKVIPLNGHYIDVKGVKYSGTITLLPYTSAVLMVDPDPSIPPASPSYVSSAIENATPSVLEMTYSLSLANIVPAVSAFTVLVNSTARTISSVAISGSKVILTLASPINAGNVVTIAYTKPSVNPLQTTAGGLAATISAQSVTNRVAAPVAPVFSGAVIENSTPSRVEMTYSLSLASILPAASAFAVNVNSVARTVSSVSISGTKVLLTLASPVAYGNTVTVAYTKPTTNPLQTSSGGLAATINAQTVTNKVAAPAAPVFSGAVIENSTPSRVEMTYSLSLASILPAASAFTVNVNSVARTVSSVSISGTKVLLTLASPVAYGNTVSVAYTKPAANPLQTSAGGLAATINAQVVTNKVQAINALPVVAVNSTSSNLSGFVGELDATDSYDPNKDNLSYSWVPPVNISVSSTTSSKIQFLSPIVAKPSKFDFTLHISDGKATQSKVIPVEILPYKPELEVAEILNVEASSFNSPYNPHNVLDENIGTMWAANGHNQWLILELKEPFNIQHVRLGFKPGQKSESYFDILGSEDNLIWDPILLKSTSCDFSGDPQVFDFPASKAEKEYKYIKLVGQSNSTDSWNYISEFKIFGYRLRNPLSYEELPVKIYPNPAIDYFTVRIEDPALIPDAVKIINLSGTIVFQDEVNPDIREFRIPINFNKGMYVIQLQSNGLVLFAQKLIVL